MSILDWLVFGFMVALTAVALRSLPRFWRHETTFYDDPAAWWLWGDVLWRSFVRCMPIGVMGCVIALVCWGAASAVPEESWGEFARPWWYIVPTLALLAALVTLLSTITLLNRPKALVPPHLRDQPGAIREWLEQRRGQGGRGAKRDAS